MLAEGLPPRRSAEGVLNVVTGNGRSVLGAHLVSHKDTDLVSMTGSVRAGGEIYALGAKLIKPIRLELEGKAPFIVMEDADVGKAVEAAVASKFFFGGSAVCCNDRMYLHAKIHDEFLDKFVGKVKGARGWRSDPSRPATSARRISAVEVDKLKHMAARALERRRRSSPTSSRSARSSDVAIGSSPQCSR